MIAIAWVDTAEGRRWATLRGLVLLLLGAIIFAVGLLAGARSLVWLGGGLFALGGWAVAWAGFHAAQGQEFFRRGFEEPHEDPSDRESQF